MTRITDIFGTHLRDMMSYVRWVHSQKGTDWVNHNHAIGVSTGNTRDYLVEKAHTFLSQPMESFNEEGLNELLKGDWSILHKKGKWIIMYGIKKVCDYDSKMPMNTFATHCTEIGIELELNEEYIL